MEMDILQSLIDFFSTYGYAAVLGVLLLCGFGLPIPEDVTLVSGGVISGLGYTNVHIMFLISMVGVLFGDGLVFTLGHLYGEKILKFKIVAKIMTPERYAAVQKQFEKYGKWVIFMARFMPGLRTPVFLIAGITRRVSFARFFLTDGFAALISVPIWVYLGYFGARNFELLKSWIRTGQIGILMVLGLVVAAIGIAYLVRKRK